MGDSARFTQSHGIVPLMVSDNGVYSGALTLDSINMAKYNHCTIIIMGDGAISGDAVLTIKGGADDGTQTAAITFTYRYSAGDCKSASADVLGAAATSASLEITGASLVDRMLICEFDAQDLVVSGVTYQYATAALSDAGSAGYITAVAILSEPRYMEAIMDTAIPTS